ncbi:unnamed protein product, partial [Ectocarpus sp. 12 AP-2014]
WKEVVPEYAEGLGLLILGLTAVFGLYQYTQGREDRVVDRTFKYLEQFEGERLTSAQREIDSILRSARGRAIQEAEDQRIEYVNAQEKRDIEERLYITEVLSPVDGSSTDIPNSLLNLTSYFNGVQSCIELEQCSKATAEAFLKPYADSLWSEVQPIAEFVRLSGRPKFASGLQSFVDQSRDVTP